jgi:hypothetical protein
MKNKKISNEDLEHIIRCIRDRRGVIHEDIFKKFLYSEYVNKSSKTDDGNVVLTLRDPIYNNEKYGSVKTFMFYRNDGFYSPNPWH